MYLVSIYFDEKTDKRIAQYIRKVAEVTGNTFMTDGNVPPHITVSAFETRHEMTALNLVENIVKKLNSGHITWASVGQFFPYVIYMMPVLNEYLQNMSETIYDELSQQRGITISPYYKPFQWLPHATIGKKLSKDEMKKAFEIMQESFGVFESQVVKIGLAKPNPHRDIKIWEL